MSRNGRVLVAMSGGIDSTVSALMLHEQGYEVIGVTMKTWDYANSGGSRKETGCCNLDSFNDARLAAVEHGFPHYVIDIREEFGASVINNFIDEYIAGRTPNPCVMCNTHIKWEALLKRANSLDCAFIATGHYVKVRQHTNGRYVLSKAKDPLKDQSYVLWGLTQECLSRSIYPLGGLLKTEVRQLAFDMGYKELSRKSESYEICFVPDNDYRGFLKRNVKGLEEQVENGDFVTTDGQKVGKHKGYPFYTIGQRKGLEVALGRPVYVTQIIPETNTVVLGGLEDLIKNRVIVRELNMSKYETLPENFEAITKIRYHDPGAISLLHLKEGKMEVTFNGTVSGVAPGQSAVFYEGADVIGGGIIESGQMVM